MGSLTILVLGADAAAQMDKFRHVTHSARNDPHIVEADVLDELRQRYALVKDKPHVAGRSFEQWLPSNGLARLADGAEPDRARAHEGGWFRVDSAGVATEARARRKPFETHWVDFDGSVDSLPLNAGASGWTVGGQWRDERRVEGRAGVARKRDVDFRALRDAAALDACEMWDRATAARGGAAWETLDAVWQRLGGGAGVSDAYRRQPAVAAMIAAGCDDYHRAIDWLGVSRDEFVRRARDEGIASRYFHVLHDGRFLEDDSEAAWLRLMNEPPQGLAVLKQRRDAASDRFRSALAALSDDGLLTSASMRV